MPELDAYETMSILMNKHFPTYFFSEKTHKKDLIGAIASSYLAYDILKICDNEIWKHIKLLPPLAYFFPLLAAFHAISQPFTELLKLLDFMYCFGVYLNPIIAVAQIIVNKKLILSQNPNVLLKGILNQRKWMNQKLNAQNVIDCTMTLIMKLK